MLAAYRVATSVIAIRQFSLRRTAHLTTVSFVRYTRT